MRPTLSLLALAAALPGALLALPFREVAAEIGLTFTHFNGMTGERWFVENLGSGVALVDYDLDGDLDVYLVQGAFLAPAAPGAEPLVAPAHPQPLSDRLYRNDRWVDTEGRPRFRFVDVTERAGLQSTGATGYGMGVATGDHDGDGWPDFYVTNFGENALLRNQGDGTFRDVTAEAGAGDDRWSVPAVFLDFDDDGHLDLFVGNYAHYRVEGAPRCVSQPGGQLDYCNPGAFRPETNRLLRNLGDGRFGDVTASAGMAAAAGRSLGAVAADFDGDGRLDLYVANDLMPNELWFQKEPGRFTEEGLFAGAAVNAEGKSEASMGIAVGDPDEDGDFDLLVTHLSGETNTYYRNDGGLFTDATTAAGLGVPSFPWTGFGTAFLDADGDGKLDLVVANGAVRTLEAQRRAGEVYPLREPNSLYRGLGGGRFENVDERTVPELARQEVSRGLAVGDLDGDGDADVVISNSAGPARVWLDERPPPGWWNGWRVVEKPGWRDALAATVVLGDRPGRLERIATDGSYGSASSPALLFAGAGEVPPPVTVAPRGKRKTRWPAPPAGHVMVVRR